eukprot:Hpha_TRINITY_DN15950_c1_g3::TRINITY_DN15950_c1_g3_i1::g.70687::m.70687
MANPDVAFPKSLSAVLPQGRPSTCRSRATSDSGGAVDSPRAFTPRLAGNGDVWCWRRKHTVTDGPAWWGEDALQPGVHGISLNKVIQKFGSKHNTWRDAVVRELGPGETFLSLSWHVSQLEGDDTNDLFIPCGGEQRLRVPVEDWRLLQRPLHYLMHRGARRRWDVDDDDQVDVVDRQMARLLLCRTIECLDELWSHPETVVRPFAELSPASWQPEQKRIQAVKVAVDAAAALDKGASHLTGMWRKTALDAALCAGMPDVLKAMLRGDGSRMCCCVRRLPTRVRDLMALGYECEEEDLRDVAWDDLWLSGSDDTNQVIDQYVNEYGLSLQLAHLWCRKKKKVENPPGKTAHGPTAYGLAKPHADASVHPNFERPRERPPKILSQYPANHPFWQARSWRGQMPFPPEEERWDESVHIPLLQPGQTADSLCPPAARGMTDWVRQMGESLGNLCRRLRRLCLRELLLGSLLNPKHDRFGILCPRGPEGSETLCLGRVLQRAPWILQDVELVQMLAKVLLRVAGLVGGQPSRQETEHFAKVHEALVRTYAPMRILRRHSWRPAAKGDLPGQQSIAILTDMGLLHWACMLHCPRLMIAVAEVHSVYLVSNKYVARQLVAPAKVQQEWGHGEVEKHSPLWLCCYSATLNKRPVLRTRGNKGWSLLIDALVAGNVKAKQDNTDVDASGYDTDSADVSVEAQPYEGDDGTTNVDSACTASEVACHFGHSVVLRNLLQHDELLTQEGAARRNSEGLDTHDVALLIRRRAELQGSGSETLDIMDESLVLLQDRNEIQRKMVRLTDVFFGEVWVHLLFVVVVTTLALTNCFQVDGKAARMSFSIKSIFADTELPLGYDAGSTFGAMWDPDGLEGVAEVSHVRSWIKNILPLKVLRPWTEYGDQGGYPLPSGPYAMWDRVGPVRLCRMPLVGDYCEVPDRAYTECQMQRDRRIPCSGAVTTSYFSFLSWQSSATDIIYDLSQTDRECLLLRGVEGNETDANLTKAVHSQWISESSRLIAVHSVFYNAFEDRFVVAEVYFEITPEGLVYSHVVSTPVRLHDWGELAVWERMFWGGFIALIISSLVVETFEALDGLQLVLITEREYRRENDTPLCMSVMRGIFRFLWTWAEQEGNVITAVTIVLGILTFISLGDLQDRAAALSKVQSLTCTDVSGAGNFDDTWIEVARLSSRIQISLGLTMLLSFFATTKYLRRLGSIGDVVHAVLVTFSAREVLTLMLLFVIYLIAFWLTLFTVFGYEVSEFHSLPGSFMTVFRFFFGDWGDSMDESLHANRFFATALFVLMMVWITLFFLNILIAVLSEAYMRKYVPENYRTYMAREVYLPKKLLAPKAYPWISMFPLLQSLYERFRRVRMYISNEADEGRKWRAITSPESVSQHRHAVRQRMATIGEVADISRQIARIVINPPGTEKKMEQIVDMMAVYAEQGRTERLAIVQEIQQQGGLGGQGTPQVGPQVAPTQAPARRAVSPEQERRKSRGRSQSIVPVVPSIDD